MGRRVPNVNLCKQLEIGQARDEISQSACCVSLRPICPVPKQMNDRRKETITLPKPL